MTRAERILALLNEGDGLTDREITDIVDGPRKPQQPVNRKCNELAKKGKIIRRYREDGKLGNYLCTSKEDIPNSTEIKNEVQKLTGIESSPHGLAIEQLVNLGFEKVGFWMLQDKELIFDLVKNSEDEKILYAFVVNGDIKYIGKSIQSLQKRIYLYKVGHDSQKTNFRVNAELVTALSTTDKVDIYAFIPKIPLFYSDVEIDLAAGLESGIIEKFNPEWNIQK
ncbi:GIY-YIG nuclease family protein (plasmid) [Chloroflexota bacterium]|nr:GIY-YIG nuclease family protein [Chloroflexota bacterium]